MKIEEYKAKMHKNIDEENSKYNKMHKYIW